ncbi:MAG: tetratricopeptide repeat protein [Planctomycetes bacterium]|nr:tetratricopeptide repeat protein [Planctomycetota bacterium]
MAARARKSQSQTARIPAAADAGAPGRGLVTAALVLAALTLAVYLPSLGNDFLNWDDNSYVTENAHVRDGLSIDTVTWAFRSREAANWHPLTWLSHAADVTLFGMRPWGHHLTSILLHALNSALLLIALHRLTRRLWPSAVVAALFALHPLHVESVSWVAERKDVLCGTFTFLTLWAYAVYASRPSVRRYLLVALAFAAALMSKPMAVTVPFVLLLLDVWPLGRLSWRSVAEKLPLAAMTAASCVVTFLVQQHGRAVRDLEALPLAQRLANASYAYAMYLAKTFWPWPGTLVPFYPLADRGGPLIGVPAAAGFAAVLLAVTIAALILWRRRRPQLLVGWLVYVGMLVPVIGLVQVGKQIMADRYTYLPLVGVFVAVAWLVAEWAATYPHRRRAVVVATGVALVILGGLTVRQQRVWRDPVTFWEYNAQAWPQNGVAWDSLSAAYWARAMDPSRTDRQQANVARAIAAGRKAIAAQDDDARFFGNLGNMLLGAGQQYGDGQRIAEAETHYRKALDLDPTWQGAETGLGNAALWRKDYDGAIEHFRRAVDLDPDFASTHYNLAQAYYAKGDLDSALEAFKKAATLRPDWADACHNVAAVLYAQGKTEEAMQWKKREAELGGGRN